MMTPQEKAEELVRKYYSFGLNNPAQSFSWHECKQCALIAVDEILEAKTKILNKGDGWQLVECNIYWKEVKTEIQNL